MRINIINNIISITYYSLALFVCEYLRTNWAKLGSEKMGIPEELEQSILFSKIIQSDGSINKQASIYLRTARKWLNCLSYKWREVQKRVFFDGAQREDVVEYQEIFLSEIKLFQPYFIEFSDNGSIWPQVYPNNCAVGRTNWWLIIMIIYDEYTFLTNDCYQKVWFLEGHDILRPKRKEKRIMVSEFLLPWFWLNILSFLPQQQKELVTSGITLETVTYFKNRKMKNGY